MALLMDEYGFKADEYQLIDYLLSSSTEERLKRILS